MRNISQIFTFSILKTFTKKTFITFSIFLYTQQMFAQLSDNFDDGDFSKNPVWSGQDIKFSAATNQLKLQAPAVTEDAYLSTKSAAINDASWEFFAHLGFNPSSTNYARVYLVSSQSNLADTLKGYFVMIGNTTDEISLYKQSGSTRTKIIDGADGKLNLPIVDVRIKVTRDAAGNWQLFSDVGLTGAYTLEGSATDATFFSSSYTGVYCNYTATRSDKFSFDDFVVTGKAYVAPAPPTYKDVIITEIFADPTPRVELPETEFVELLNRGTASFNLSGWTLSDGSSTATIPSYTLAPGEYVVLMATSSVANYSSQQNVIGLSSFPSLNNAGDVLMLKYRGGIMIDSVQYSDSWYKNDDKKSGGWSLELIDPNNICGEENNWAASENKDGGTPGKQNSVYANKPDLTGPALLAAVPVSDRQLMLQFNEKLLKEIPSIENFYIAPEVTIDKISFTDQSLRAFNILLSTPLQEKQLYTIKLKNIYDCNGNNIQTDYSVASFALPQKADSLDVLINEILFNPRPTGEDFLEIVNTSDKYLNLKNWSVATVKDGAVDKVYTITNKDFLFQPGAYLVLTKDVDILAGEYPQTKTANVLEMNTFPSWNDDAGNVLIMDDQKNAIDYFAYTKSMHSVFIKDEEGVSLERIAFSEPTNDSNNWKSASTTSGYATPGFINSNTTAGSVLSGEEVVVSPEVFIPASGTPNFTEIQYKFNQGGYIANVNVYDANGLLIKKVANNELLGTEGFLRWDGDRDDGTKARIGYYLVSFEVFNAAGVVKTFRKRLAVAAKF